MRYIEGGRKIEESCTCGTFSLSNQMSHKRTTIYLNLSARSL